MARLEIDSSWQAHLRTAIGSSLEHIGQKVEDAAKRIVPVESGDLRDSITHEMDDGAIVISAGSDDVDYAAAVETGTRYMAAQPYLRPALTSVSRDYR